MYPEVNMSRLADPPQPPPNCLPAYSTMPSLRQRESKLTSEEKICMVLRMRVLKVQVRMTGWMSGRELYKRWWATAKQQVGWLANGSGTMGNPQEASSSA